MLLMLQGLSKRWTQLNRGLKTQNFRTLIKTNQALKVHRTDLHVTLFFDNYVVVFLKPFEIFLFEAVHEVFFLHWSIDTISITIYSSLFVYLCWGTLKRNLSPRGLPVCNVYNNNNYIIDKNSNKIILKVYHNNVFQCQNKLLIL